MSFEYGCAITNKYAFLDEGEDPSDLLAQVSVVDKAGSKDAKTGKDAKSAKGGKDAKAGSKDAKTGGKDAKKQPLQQQTDNSVKSGSKDGGDAKKASGGQQQQQGQNKPRQPELNKENAVNRQAGGGSGRPFGDRRPLCRSARRLSRHACCCGGRPTVCRPAGPHRSRKAGTSR